MEKECLQLADCLKSLSPKLHINIKPRGFDDNFLRTLCKTKQQKEQLEAFLAKDSTFTNCSTCNTVLEGILLLLYLYPNLIKKLLR